MTWGWVGRAFLAATVVAAMPPVGLVVVLVWMVLAKKG
jgi:hypothetical protein